MDVNLPDGTVVNNVPDGISKADLVSKLSANGMDTSWYKPDAAASANIPITDSSAATNNPIPGAIGDESKYSLVNPSTTNVAPTKPTGLMSVHDQFNRIFQNNAEHQENHEKNVGAIESLARGALQEGSDIGRLSGLAFTAPVMAYDAIRNKITGENDTSASDYANQMFVKPWESRVDWASIKPDEKQNFLGKLSSGIGSMLTDLPLIIASGGTGEVSSIAKAVPSTTQYLADTIGNGFKAMRPLMVKSGEEKAEEVLKNGGSTAEAITAATTEAFKTGFMGSSPMSIEGHFFQRLATGLPVGAVVNEVSRRIDNASLPENMQQPFSWENTAIGATQNAILSGAMGHPNHPTMPSRTDLGYESPASVKVEAAPAEFDNASPIVEKMQAIRPLSNTPQANEAAVVNAPTVDAAIAAASKEANAADIPVAQSLTVDHIQPILDSINPKMSTGEVNVVPTTTDLPENIKQRIGSNGEPVEGVYTEGSGKVHLVADQFDNLDRVHEVLGHELVGHLAPTEIIDPKIYSNAINSVIAMDKSGNANIRQLGDIVDARQPGLDQHTRAKEIMALAVENNSYKASPVLRRVASDITYSVKKFLINQGIDHAWVNKLSDHEVHSMLREGERRLYSGKPEAITQTPAAIEPKANAIEEPIAAMQSPVKVSEPEIEAPIAKNTFSAPAQINDKQAKQVFNDLPGIKAGDLVNAKGSHFNSKEAAQSVAKLAGPGWRVQPSKLGYTVRFRPASDAQIAAAKANAKARDSINTDTDSLHAAIAKLGGMNRDELVKDWGADPKELAKLRSGIKLVAPTKGLSVDRIADSLKELGYIGEDEHGKHDLNELMDHFFNELGGDKHYTADGYARVAKDQEAALHEDYLAEKEIKDAEFTKLSETYQKDIDNQIGEFEDLTEEDHAKLEQDLQQWEDWAKLNQHIIPDNRDEELDSSGRRLVSQDGEIGRDSSREGPSNEDLYQPYEGARSKQEEVRGTRSGSQGTSEEFGLKGQTEEEARAQADQQAKLKQEQELKAKEAEQRAQADADRDSFNLTGSDRKADVEAANGQQDLLASNPEAQVEKAKEALDEAGVTGTDRTSTIAAVRRGDLTAQEVAESHKPATKIEDFGEVIGGAKKDLWQTYQKAMSEELPVDAKNITLSKHFPEPNYEKLIEAGVNVKSLAAVKAMRDAIPTKPQKAYRVTRWADQVRLLREFANGLISGKADVNQVVESMRKIPALEEIANRIDLYSELGYPAFKNAKGYEITGGWQTPGNPGHTQFALQGERMRNVYFNTREAAVESLKTLLDIKAEMPTEKKSTSFDIYRVTKTGDIVVGKKVASGKYIDLKTGFKDAKEARTYLRENQESLEKLLESKKENPVIRRGVNEPRVGEDYRKGDHISPEEFKAEFGFRGTQFGNYVEQGRRQQDLNNSYDALRDMAKIIDIPSKAISLDGELALAFGARGNGGPDPAAAHYEPGQVVINLTKTNGFGSLAHEWFHALDNYFGKASKEHDYLTYANRNKAINPENVRPEVANSFREVMNAIKASDYYKRSTIIDKYRSKDYWSTNEELGARAFEAYIATKAKEKGESNDYLANIIGEDGHEAFNSMQRDLGGDEKPYPYPTKAEQEKINPAFDKLFNTLQTKETDKGVALFSRLGRVIPESKWLSESSIAEKIDESIGKFAHQPPIFIRDRASDVVALPAGANDSSISGVTVNGKIYIFRAGLSSSADVAKTVWHEMLHYGLRRFMTQDQYISAMGDLHSKDVWIKSEANQWVNSKAGQEAVTQHGQEYAQAIGVDEALAKLAENNQGHFKNQSLQAKTIRTVSRWIASLAEKLGFTKQAQEWNAVSNDQARELIHTIFGKLESDATPIEGNSGFTANPAFRSEDQKDAWYYSPLERGIESAPDRLFTKAPQVKLWLASNAAKLGVKAEEIQWSGVNDWLDLKGKESVSKQDILNYLKDGGVQLKEVNIADRNTDKLDSKVDELQSRLQKVMPGTVEHKEIVNEIGNIQQEIRDAGNTKYEKYTLPGGSNYHEMLLTLPKAKSEGSHGEIIFKDENELDDFLTDLSSEGLENLEYGAIEENGKRLKVEFSGLNESDLMGFNSLAITNNGSIKSLSTQNSAPAYRSSHWDQPNVLAHIRMNDRTDAQGNKVLFIEEIQSDWHQAGRKRGYTGGSVELDGGYQWDAQSQNALGVKENDPAWVVKDSFGKLVGRYMSKEFANKVLSERNKDLTPDAPFKDTKAWTSLALKRIISHAAENGYDKVAFVNGDQSADRYNLSKQIESIQYKPSQDSQDGKFYVSATDKKGNSHLGEWYTPEQIEQNLGKEITKKIVDGNGNRISGTPEDSPMKELTGLDLQVGGEGMKDYYNKIVPQVANDVLKKVGGGKLELTDIPSIDDPSNYMNRRTEYVGAEPSRADIQKVLIATHSFGPDSRINPITGENMEDIVNLSSNAASMKAVKNAMEHGSSFFNAMNAHGSLRIAEIFGLEHKTVSTQPEMYRQTGFTITPEMRKQSEEGLPLFSKKAKNDETPTNPSGGKSEDLWDRARSFIGNVTNGIIEHPVTQDLLLKVAPMSTGSEQARAVAKDFANADRTARWQWNSFDDILKKNFTEEQLKSMWEAADEENVLRQKGEKDDSRGLGRLTSQERAVVENLHQYGEELLQRAKEVGMFKGEGLPFWAPRMAVMLGDDGEYYRPPTGVGGGAKEGGNITTSSQNLKQRKYLTSEETEAAMKAKLGDEAQLIKNIRTMPLAMARLERAIAGRELVNSIKDLGSKVGTNLVSSSEGPGFFTVDHPAFKTFKPRMVEEDGKFVPVKDQNGDMIFDRTPIYISDEFKGPLKAIMTDKPGAIYQALMTIKAKAMGLIMYSPIIHNAVEWGRALPIMPGKVLTFKIYFEGNAIKNNPAQMRQAIKDGLVPIGHRAGMQDITGLMEDPTIEAGRSWTAKIAGKIADQVSEDAGQSVRKGIDKAGDIWHNTLLWDRVGDLQAGIYSNVKADLVGKGMDESSAGRIAAHFANRFAGALPNEAMSASARKIANFALFSRTFTLGNLGVLKDAITGLPTDVKAQISRDATELGMRAAKNIARKEAIGAIVFDMGLMLVGNSLLQDALNVMNGQSLDETEDGYVRRFKSYMSSITDNPFNLVSNLSQISSTADNEPGKENRIRYGTDSDGTGLYFRLPIGKIGEEFSGWLTSPLKTLQNKEGTIMRPLGQIWSNDKSLGQPLYDPYAKVLSLDTVKNAGRVSWALMGSQLPTDALVSAYDIARGKGDDTDIAKTVGPLAGITTSKGAPGGPAVGEMYDAERQYKMRLSFAMPDVKRAIKNEDVDRAVELLQNTGMPDSEIRSRLKSMLEPQSRMNHGAIKRFEKHSTDEQKDRFSNAVGS